MGILLGPVTVSEEFKKELLNGTLPSLIENGVRITVHTQVDEAVRELPVGLQWRTYGSVKPYALIYSDNFRVQIDGPAIVKITPKDSDEALLIFEEPEGIGKQDHIACAIEIDGTVV